MEFYGIEEDLPEHVEELLTIVFESNGFDKCRVKVETLGKKGDNYCSNVRRIIAEDEEKRMKVVAKLAPFSKRLREMLFTRESFTNESTLYLKLIPKLAELQQEVEIPKDEQFSATKCYLFAMEPTEVLILEDLNASGFKILDKFVPYTNEQTILTMKTLAKFHALTCVLKVKNKELYDEITSNLIDLWVDSYAKGDILNYFESIAQNTSDKFEDVRYKNVIKESTVGLPKLSKEIYDTAHKSKYSMVVLGDVWTNNMMFKLNDGNAVELKLLDFQQARLGCPATDIHYFILNCTEYESRAEHYNEWLKVYYSTFDDMLIKFDMDIDVIYPKEEFYHDLKRCSLFGFGNAILSNSFIAREDEDVVDMDNFSLNVSVAKMSQKSEQRFTRKVDGMIRSFRDFGYFD